MRKAREALNLLFGDLAGGVFHPMTYNACEFASYLSMPANQGLQAAKAKYEKIKARIEMHSFYDDSDYWISLLESSFQKAAVAIFTTLDKAGEEAEVEDFPEQIEEVFRTRTLNVAQMDMISYLDDWATKVMGKKKEAKVRTLDKSKEAAQTKFRNPRQRRSKGGAEALKRLKDNTD